MTAAERASPLTPFTAAFIVGHRESLLEDTVRYAVVP